MMRVQLHRSSTITRILTLAGLALAISLVGVQAAGGAGSSHIQTPKARQASGQVASAQTPDPTPANQPALDTAADDAQSVAGDSYYTDAVVNDDANTVDLYLANAPQSIIDQLQAMHPGVYVIHNDAAYPLAELLKAEDSLALTSLQSQGVTVLSVGPTPDGHLSFGVSTNAATAQSTLDALLGSGIPQVHEDVSAAFPTGYRYNDSANWNSGDFIYHKGGANFYADCTSGFGVKTSSGTTYMLTAAHCFYLNFGGVGTNVRNGYVEKSDGSTVYGNGNLIGAVSKSDHPAYNSTSLDTALIGAPTGYDMFKSGWNSSEIAAVAGDAENHSGDYVCTSGAFDGQICNLEIHDLNQTVWTCDQNLNCFYVQDVADAWNPNNSSAVGVGDGDSGGPVYSYNGSGNALARGMIDSGGSGTEVSCTSNPPGMSGRVCSHVLYFVEEGYINSHWSVTPIHN
jgi:hypothetical protein